MKRLVILSGHYDFVSGYQEVELSKALGELPNVKVYVITSSCVYHKFRTDGLKEYALNVQRQNRILVIRPRYEVRLGVVVFSLGVIGILKRLKPDLILSMNPGQGQPVWGSFYKLYNSDCKLASYMEDNKAQYNHLTGLPRYLKRIAFYTIKGPLYLFTNVLADRNFINTPQGFSWLRGLYKPKKAELFPVSASRSNYYFSEPIREESRKKLGIENDSKTILLCGTPSKKKMIEHFISDLINELSSKDYKGELPTLLFTGGLCNDLPKEVMQRVAGLRMQVIDLGFVDQKKLNEAFNAADIAVWPRQPAITIQQASLTGLPVIINKCETMSHLRPQPNVLISDTSSNFSQMAKLAIETRASNKQRIEMSESWHVSQLSDLKARVEQVLDLFRRKQS